MTCIVGIAKDGKVYLGADSALGYGYKKAKLDVPKIFELGEFIIGISGYPRFSQLIQYSLNLPQQKSEESDMGYLINVFVKAIINCIDANQFTSSENSDGKEIPGSNMIFGYRGNLYVLDSNFQIVQTTENYAAIGSGMDEALAALKTMELTGYAVHPKDAIKTALKVSSYFNMGVDEPFRVINK